MNYISVRTKSVTIQVVSTLYTSGSHCKEEPTLQAMQILKDKHLPQQIRKSNDRTKFVTTKSSI